MDPQTLPFYRKRSFWLVTFILLLFYATVLLPNDVFLRLIEEDGLFENLTAIFFLLTAIGFFLLFINGKYIKNPDLRTVYSSRPKRYLFLLLALVFFFGFGEEISWGQRIFGFETPESLAAKNSQKEFNIHNLEIFNVRDTEGVRKEGLAKLFTMKQLFLYCFFIYLFVIPFLDRNSDKISNLLKRFYIPIPPLWLGVLFIGNYALYRILRIFTDQDADPTIAHGLTEMQEFNFSIVLLLIPFTWFWVSKKVTRTDLKST